MLAFFPISVSAQLFSSARLIEALSDLPADYTEILFFVADRLQMYNDAFNPEKTEHRVYQYWAKKPSEIFLDRKKWIQRIVQRLSIDQSRIQVVSIDDVADGEAFRIFRGLCVFHSLNHAFAEDVDAEVHRAVARKPGWTNYESARRLSRIYVLEELALNLRLRARWNVTDEFYLGPQMVILPELFHGRHAWYLENVGLCDAIDVSGARFFYWAEEGSWKRWSRGSDIEAGYRPDVVV